MVRPKTVQQGSVRCPVDSGVDVVSLFFHGSPVGVAGKRDVATSRLVVPRGVGSLWVTVPERDTTHVSEGDVPGGSSPIKGRRGGTQETLDVGCKRGERGGRPGPS